MKHKNVIPLNIRLLEKNRVKISNQKIADRLLHEDKMNIGKKEFIPCEKVLSNEVALKQWKRITRIYEDFEFVKEIDNQVLNNYCLLCAELDEIRNTKQEIKNENIVRYARQKKLNELKLDDKEYKLLELSLKYEDKLFLNPAARLRSLPAKQKEREKSYLDEMGFGNV